MPKVGNARLYLNISIIYLYLRSDSDKQEQVTPIYVVRWLLIDIG